MVKPVNLESVNDPVDRVQVAELSVPDLKLVAPVGLEPVNYHTGAEVAVASPAESAAS